MNNLALAVAVFTAPTAAFIELRERPRFWLPLLAILAASILQLIWYYNIVDIEWLKDHMFAGNKQIEALSPEARARVSATMSQKTMLWSSVISVAVVMPLLFGLMAAYYALAGKITNVQYTYKQWFSLACWTALPALIGAAVGCISLAMEGTNAQLGPSELQILSLNELFFQRTPSQPGYQLLVSLSVFTLWSWVLSVVAVKVWSQRSWLFSATFALLPILLVYGLWAVLAF